MTYVCKENQCTGCKLCSYNCPHDAIKIEESLSTVNAVIDMDKCTGCGLCQKSCQICYSIKLKRPIFAVQGWSQDQKIRKKSASGGFATAIAQAFVKNGGVVCSCLYKEGEFLFEKAGSCDEIKNFSGSKYVKSDPKDVYKILDKELKTGTKCLFIGLPCQVAAVKIKYDKQYGSQLYTIDLICHGTPSRKLLDIFLKQHGTNLKTLKNIRFREKSQFGIRSEPCKLKDGVMDCYTIAFLNSLIYTKNCYSCKYATFERVGDITLGDSWGSLLPKQEQNKGISLALCQTDKGKELLRISNLKIFDVDLDIAVKTNHQLEYPSVCPTGYEKFFEKIQAGYAFDKLIRRQYPQQCLRQFAKKILIKFDFLPYLKRKG